MSESFTSIKDIKRHKKCDSQALKKLLIKLEQEHKPRRANQNLNLKRGATQSKNTDNIFHRRRRIHFQGRRRLQKESNGNTAELDRINVEAIYAKTLKSRKQI